MEPVGATDSEPDHPKESGSSLPLQLEAAGAAGLPLPPPQLSVPDEAAPVAPAPSPPALQSSLSLGSAQLFGELGAGSAQPPSPPLNPAEVASGSSVVTAPSSHSVIGGGVGEEAEAAFDAFLALEGAETLSHEWHSGHLL